MKDIMIYAMCANRYQFPHVDATLTRLPIALPSVTTVMYMKGYEEEVLWQASLWVCFPVYRRFSYLGN